MGGKIRKEVLADTPHIYTVTCTTANTEYPLSIPASTKYFVIRPRGDYAIRYAFETGKVAGPVEPYATVNSGAFDDSPPLELQQALTIYFASGAALSVVEVVAWE